MYTKKQKPESGIEELVEKDGEHYILSNNHVIADSNNGVKNVDAVIQPGTSDGGSSPADDIAVLSDFKDIDFTGASNDIDAAIAKVGAATQTIIDPAIIDIGLPKTTPKTAMLYQSVRKHGRTTGHKVGVITDLSANIWVGYGPGKTAWFTDQIAVTGIGYTNFSSGGDSGSLIVDAVSLEPVALLFAGGNILTFANPIDLVLSYFGVTIVP